LHYDFDTLISRKDTASLKWDKYQGTEILPFWVADMDFAIAPEIQQALLERLAHPIFGYTRASDELIEAFIANLESLYGWQVQPEWLVWIPGVVAGLSACTRAYLQPGDRLLTHVPIYQHFFRVHDTSQNELIRAPLHKLGDRWTYDLEAMESLLTPSVRLVMLCSPHNPTGTVFTAEELSAVVALASRHGATVVSDEIHCGLVLNEATPHQPTALVCPDNRDSIVTLMSQSKTFNLAGMNCSCAIIPDIGRRNQFRQACAAVLPFVSTLAYTSALAAYQSGEPWRNALVHYLRGNYALVREQLDGLDGLVVERCDATFLAWLDVRALGLNQASEFFERHGVGFSDGDQFGAPGWLRMNFACSRHQLEEGIGRIRSAIATL